MSLSFLIYTSSLPPCTYPPLPMLCARKTKRMLAFAHIPVDKLQNYGTDHYFNFMLMVMKSTNNILAALKLRTVVCKH